MYLLKIFEDNSNQINTLEKEIFNFLFEELKDPSKLNNIFEFDFFELLSKEKEL